MRAASQSRVLITGGAGFVGTNLADRLATQGTRVTVLDNLSRSGVEQNLQWLIAKHGDMIRVEVADITDDAALARSVAGCDRVFHLAAQVAVTTSLVDPIMDFEVNLLGTVKLLEEVRRQPQPPSILFTSTNKVYGALPDVDLIEREDHYVPTDPALAASGIDESRPLSFCSPYGCSKGGADQYVIDYCTSFGIPATVFRMSCIYGPHQFGTEDQGWVAHFLIRALQGSPLTIYGDGKQVRDILFVDDLVDAMLLAQDKIALTRGRAFNIGGGPANTISLLQLIETITELTGESPRLEFDGWRVGDQRYYVSDTTSFEDLTGWRARTSVRDGLLQLHAWLQHAGRGAHAEEAVGTVAP